MDGRYFDDLTRALAGGRSRRLMLKGLLAGVAGLAGLRAIDAQAGDLCYGFDVECDTDANCCSGSCSEGFCTCVSPGSVCFSNDDCCDGLFCDEGVCAIGDACGAAESLCDYDSDCCDGLYCAGSTCAAIPETCAPLFCSSLAPCCDNKVCLTSLVGGVVDGEVVGGGACYIRAGELCDKNGPQGCEMGECVDGYCGGPPVCIQAFAECSDDEDCCNDLVCTDGLCAEAGEPEPLPSPSPSPEPNPGEGDGDGDGGGTGTGGEEYAPPATLPSTGVADGSANGVGGLLAAGLAAGAAALILHKSKDGTESASN